MSTSRERRENKPEAPGQPGEEASARRCPTGAGGEELAGALLSSLPACVLSSLQAHFCSCGWVPGMLSWALREEGAEETTPQPQLPASIQGRRGGRRPREGVRKKGRGERRLRSWAIRTGS